MALTSNPTAQQIAEEFGGATYPYDSIADYQLAGMYNRVFGGGNHDRLRFGNTGKASITSEISVSTSDNVVTVSVGVDVGGESKGVLGYVDYYWADGDDGIPDSSTNWNKYASTSSPSNGTQSWSEEFSNGDYYFKVDVFNGYISEGSDRLEDISYDLVSLGSGGGGTTLSTPSINTCYDSFGNRMTAEWDYSDVANHFNGRIRINSGNWLDTTLEDSSNWGTSTNPKSGTWSVNQLFDPGDVVEIQVQAVDGSDTSDWSQSCSVTI